MTTILITIPTFVGHRLNFAASFLLFAGDIPNSHGPFPVYRLSFDHLLRPESAGRCEVAQLWVALQSHYPLVMTNSSPWLIDGP